MNKLSAKDTFLVGLMLFSMFFGAGNLIFPPFLGAQAGVSTWVAMAGFALSAIGLPVLGVVAVAKAGGLPQLAGRVGKGFAVVFTILTYLSIGPCLAIPRTASTSFEMAVTPLSGKSELWLRALYSLVFFGVALVIALRPEKLTDRLGRITGPVLLTLLVILVVACLLHPPGGYGPVGGPYTENALSQGFLDGYQTMDTIAALNFGIIVALNIQTRGVREENAVVRSTIHAGWIAGAFLLVVYASLARVGAVSGAAFPGATNGAGVLTNLADWLFGPWGTALLGLVFVIACLNTCIGLLSCCWEYFYNLCPKLSLRQWVLFFAAASFLVSIAGLDLILAVSVPVLNAIYPVAIVLILLGLAHRFTSQVPLCYPVGVAFTGVVSVLYALAQVGVPMSFLEMLPWYEQGLCWVLPAAIGVALGVAASLFQKKAH